MAIKLRSRKIQQIRTSLWVSIPFEWAEHHKLSKGDGVSMTLHENGEALLLKPQQNEAE